MVYIDLKSGDGINLHIYTYDGVIDASFTGKHAENDSKVMIELLKHSKQARSVTIQKVINGDVFFVKMIDF